MGSFLEERLSECIRVGSGYQDDFEVEIVRTASGQEVRRLVHPYPLRRFSIAYLENRDPFGQLVVSLYRRAYGRFAGFRFKSADDFTTADDGVSAYSFDDGAMVATSDPAIWQLQKTYNGGLAVQDVGLPKKIIYKPVADKVWPGIYNPTEDRVLENITTEGADWTVDDTTGLVTWSTISPGTITGITNASTAVVQFAAGYGFSIGQTIWVDSVSGMTEINSRRGIVLSVPTATSVELDLDSTSWGTYTTGGVGKTEPDVTETAYCGCEFDLPVRFDTSLPVDYVSDVVRSTASVELVEILNP